MGVLLALAAALAYGLSDFVGGLASRRTSAWPVAFVGAIGSLVGAVGLVVGALWGALKVAAAINGTHPAGNPFEAVVELAGIRDVLEVQAPPAIAANLGLAVSELGLAAEARGAVEAARLASRAH